MIFQLLLYYLLVLNMIPVSQLYSAGLNVRKKVTGPYHVIIVSISDLGPSQYWLVLLNLANIVVKFPSNSLLLSNFKRSEEVKFSLDLEVLSL